MFKELASATHVTRKKVAVLTFWKVYVYKVCACRSCYFEPAIHFDRYSTDSTSSWGKNRRYCFYSRIAFRNQARIIKILCLGGPSGCLGTFLEPPGSWLGRFLRRDEDWWSFWRVPGAPRSPFWKPAGPSRDPKFAKNMHLWPERRRRGASLEACFTSFCAFCVLACFCLRTNIVFHGVWIHLGSTSKTQIKG